MPPTARVLLDLQAIPPRVAASDDVTTAIDTLIADVSRALNAAASAFEAGPRGWIPLAQVRGGVRLPVADLHTALDSVPAAKVVSTLDLRSAAGGVWTCVWLDPPGHGRMLLLVSGEWTVLDEPLTSFAATASLALAYVYERQGRRTSEALLVDAYTMARRLSRLGTVDAVSSRIVTQVGRTIGADRVALALHSAEDDRLRIAATHGYPSAAVKNVAIEPGSGIMGHVFSLGRPILVPDVRQLKGFLPSRRDYRTFSFAAVPILAGTKTLGVLTATDKHDGSAFTREDVLILRTFCLAGALALMAARSDTQVHRLAYAATVDAVSGLFNRPYLDARLHQEVERAKRTGTSISLLMADIDNFKNINDRGGHLIGDMVLREVANVLRSSVRVFDVCARYGGDEFAILMPTSDDASAVACAERIRERVASYQTGSGRPDVPRVTISVGVAGIEAGDSPMDLIRRADHCLYRAKAEGKNCVRTTAGLSKAGFPLLLGGRGGDDQVG